MSDDALRALGGLVGAVVSSALLGLLLWARDGRRLFFRPRHRMDRCRMGSADGEVIEVFAPRWHEARRWWAYWRSRRPKGRVQLSVFHEDGVRRPVSLRVWRPDHLRAKPPPIVRMLRPRLFNELPPPPPGDAN